jgi:ABC-type transporter Mla MlaB component
MLKITTRRDAASTTFVLEGRLVRPWVQEMEHCWRAALVSQQVQTVRVDLTAVTFIDAAGKALLTLMAEHGAELVAVECMTKAIVEDITRGRQQPPESGITKQASQS